MSPAATRETLGARPPLGDGVPTLRPPLGDGVPTLGAPYGEGARRAVRSRRALLIGYALFLIASPALADPPSRPAPSASDSASPASSDSGSALAEALFQEALRLAKAGKFQEACPKFAASHRASRSYGAAFNLGACDEELGRTASAWAAFSEAVPLARDGGERADAEERVKALRPRLVRRRIAPPASEPGLTITWDGAPLERAAWDVDVPIDPGTHEITASAPGKQAWTKKIDATKEGETVTLQVPPLVAVAVASWPLQRTLGLATGGLGVAGVVVGSVLGGLASSRWNEAKPLCYPDNTCAPPGASMAAEARTLAHGSTASFIAGGALVATGVVLFLTSGAKAAPGPSAKARLDPWIGPDGAGSTVTVSF